MHFMSSSKCSQDQGPAIEDVISFQLNLPVKIAPFYASKSKSNGYFAILFINNLSSSTCLVVRPVNITTLLVVVESMFRSRCS